MKDKTIDEASVLCQVFQGRVGEKYQTLVNRMKVKELELETVFAEGPEMEMYEMVKELTINQANKIIGGLDQAITSCIRREGKARKMTELKELADEFV